jgi:hypothetical protein
MTELLRQTGKLTCGPAAHTLLPTPHTHPPTHSTPHPPTHLLLLSGRESVAIFWDMQDPAQPLCSSCAADPARKGHTVLQVSAWVWVCVWFWVGGGECRGGEVRGEVYFV